MRNEDERPAVVDDLLHALDALGLKLCVTHGEHFVDDENFRLEERRYRESKPHIHPAGVTLYRGIDELLESGKADNVIKFSFHLRAAHAKNGTVEKDVVPTGELRMKACPNFQQSADSAPDPRESGRRRGDSRDNLQ